ncbi:unnamed protein product [Didymodactylos carnosus]|uniref:IkappaB kinase n=1 Tax=Didymodactylos carnosus TaxID=1234261 RepID=A0A813RF61_9BILA|nr:unnamed protein product [Didymodactylos carnosus]CAF3563171.1 unnamed protein product [Didymodactylos carnosus]
MSVEETQNYFWAVQDLLGHGATSQVYKAYNKQTGDMVAAKVYVIPSPNNSRMPNAQRDKDFRPILDKELKILKGALHENIVRYIALEPVIFDATVTTPTSPSSSRVNREALFIEYCNGGSLHNLLEMNEHRYGLFEDDFLLLFKHLTYGLKHLHEKNIIHRDIKPDNIMLSINLNGERTYKLADLGVAREMLVNEGELSFKSLVGTEEYLHPDLYLRALHNGKSSDFPFEIDLWSLGVTLYQCATGELPFSPFNGTRKDRTTMKEILVQKPDGVISGIQNSSGGAIEWSKTLPASCRLSPSLKRRLEALLPRLLESNRLKLMKFSDFFSEADRLLNTVPLYYLNLKTFNLTCTYFEPSQSITQLYDSLKKYNNDSGDYYCCIQNIHYPLPKANTITIKAFCEQLPIPPSKENPLVFYTFSTERSDNNYVPKIIIPEVKPIKQYNDVAAACDWSKDVIGSFFYIKDQLMEYQNILQTAQCSTSIIQQHLKSKLVEFLCLIREKLMIFKSIDELKLILEQIDCNSNQQNGNTNMSSPVSHNNSQSPINNNGGLNRDPASGKILLGFSALLLNNNVSPTSSNENSLSPVTVGRPSSASIIQESYRHYVRQCLHPYEELVKCETEILSIIDNDFDGQSTDDSQPYSKTLWLSHRNKKYLSWLHTIETYIRKLHDLNESFRRDRLLNSYNRLQIDAHYRRRKNLEELHDKYKKFATDECYPFIVQIYQDYVEWMETKSKCVQRYEHIKRVYNKLCDDMSNLITLDDLRKMVYSNLKGGSSGGSNIGETSILLPSPPLQMNSNNNLLRQQHQGTENGGNMDDYDDEVSESDSAQKTNRFLKSIRGTTQKTLEHAEESVFRLDSVIQQLKTHGQKR